MQDKAIALQPPLTWMDDSQRETGMFQVTTPPGGCPAQTQTARELPAFLCPAGEVLLLGSQHHSKSLRAWYHHPSPSLPCWELSHPQLLFSTASGTQTVNPFEALLKPCCLHFGARLAMPALLCASLLLVACALAASADQVQQQMGSNTEEQIRDMHAKVTEIWQEMMQRQAAAIDPDAALHAVCRVLPSATLEAEQPRVSGLVLFRQLRPGALLEAFFHLEGFPNEPNGTSRAIHVHQFGDLSQGCDSTGPHYNPMSVLHPQHPGDFGNFAVRDGQVWKYRSNLAASLTGPHSIAGRAVVVHAGEDDLGRGGNQASLENGNAGRRLACCVVGLCGPGPWAHQAQENAERKKRRRESECKAV
ncbi:extracellular superoxide dismutase [Cu-Zn] isoform X1 [Ovis aries]|uniref:extracellular superoxide dismutase [Cu-Zn] isoform X1 n=2 Tax=Ovis aries TaxID=9940 RepID=UPI0029525F6D|nr:extracellular superoxide dismutase [Cu-Zn] isoform X1 [Ovis aries]